MLEGMRVIELTHLIAGPYCGRMFADHGAEVIKVEPSEGELSRHRDPVAHREGGSVTAHYASMNHGKKSVTIDLKSEAGNAFLHELLATTDVVISNMRPGPLERLGIGLESLVTRHPRLVAVSISGFGVNDTLEGERERAGLAVVAEALSGVTSLTKDRQHQPVWCGFALGDMMAGITGYSTALAALLERGRTGAGRFIDLALVDTILPLTSIAMARHQLADEQLASSAQNDFHGVPYGVFAASDGYISIGANTNKFWLGLCRAMERTDLAEDPELASFEGRSRRMTEVMSVVEDWTCRHTREQITRVLGAHDIPVAAVHRVEETIDSPRYRNRHMVRTVDDGVGGQLALPADAALRGDSPTDAVPRLGEHTTDVATEVLGDTARLASARDAGAFGSDPARAGTVDNTSGAST